MNQEAVPVRRALFSVTDKTGLQDLAKTLVAQGCEIFASGGTARYLRSHDIPVKDVGEISDNAEHFGGRMKTLSFEVAAGLLFDRERDAAEARSLSLDGIDMVVCNLYDFAAKARSTDDPWALIESIDIGGPTMIRAAAKNFAWTAAVTRPEQYSLISTELAERQGALSLGTRKRLMREAFAYTAAYEWEIAEKMAADAATGMKKTFFKTSMPLTYGENPHQQAKVMCPVADQTGFPFQLLQGKNLSWNNILDLESGAGAAFAFSEPACAVIKHAIPCGLAQAPHPKEALRNAWEGDPVSAFGGVVVFNKPLEKATDLEFLRLNSPHKNERKFLEAVAAPSFSEEVLTYLNHQPKLRAVKVRPEILAEARWEGRLLYGKYLMEQESNKSLFDKWEVATREPFPQTHEALARFGIAAARQLKSNAIAIVHQAGDGKVMTMVGAGSGQPNRVQATRLAIESAKDTLRHLCCSEQEIAALLRDCVAVSDAFFPFADSVELLAEAGIRFIVQPGGSIRDGEVIRHADERKLAMVFTGTRHFRH